MAARHGAAQWRETGVKRCPVCCETKDLTEFSIRQSGARVGHPIGRCKPCAAKQSVWQRANRKPDHYRRHEWPSKLKSQYGITAEDYYRLLEEQGGGCAICSSKISRGRTEMLPVDHDHETGQVRGILCTPCNRGLGLFNDDADRLQAAVEYLKRKAT